MILAAGGDEERAAGLVVGRDLRGRVRREVRERRLEERPARRRDRPFLEERLGLLGGELVAEAVAELVVGERDGALLVRGLAEGDRGDLQRRGRQVQHALDRRRVDRDRGGGEVLAEEPLDDQAAEGVADRDRLRLERADELGVVVDHRVDPVAGDAVGLVPRLLDRVAVAGPAGSRGLVAGLAELFDPRRPTSSRGARARGRRRPASFPRPLAPVYGPWASR